MVQPYAKHHFRRNSPVRRASFWGGFSNPMSWERKLYDFGCQTQ